MPAESPDHAHVTAHLVPHTHWDREWYLPFESVRARLLDVVGRVLDLLEDPAARFPSFTLDGQAIILEDVLEVRPEWRDRLARQVRDGRLRIGPWYVLADEYLVSPEALVRNLDLGLRTCARFGGAMSVAYTPDSFGHVAQLPSIVRGFGLETVVFERGVGDEGETLGCEFVWRSPGGDQEVFASHLIGTYSAATALGHEDWEYQDRFDPERAVSQLRAALFGPTQGRPDFPTWLRTALERLKGGIVPYGRSGHVLLLNGSDHLFPQTNLAEVIDLADGRLDGVNLMWNDVEGYVNASRTALAEAGTTLPVHQGEFRSSRYHHVLSGTWSARLPLKRMNHQVETLLERYAAPLQALAAAHGHAPDHALADHAWRTLLANHPHDSICGCSVDEVHRAMVPRFEAAARIGDDLCARAVAHLTRDVTQPTWAVFQPHPISGPAIVEVDVELPEGDASRLCVIDDRGRRRAVQLSVVRQPAPGRSDRFVEAGKAWILADLAGTSTTLLSRSSAADHDDTGVHPVARPVQVTHLREEASVRLANDLLAVTVGPRGAVVLADVKTGSTRALRFGLEDQADRGDSYDASEVPGLDARFAFAPVVSIIRRSSPPVSTGPRTSKSRKLPRWYSVTRLDLSERSYSATGPSISESSPGSY